MCVVVMMIVVMLMVDGDGDGDDDVCVMFGYVVFCVLCVEMCVGGLIGKLGVNVK